MIKLQPRKRFKYLMSLWLLLNNTIFAQPINIYISKVVDHPALDTTAQGIIDALKTAGYMPGKTVQVRTESAQASPALAQQIASKFVGQNPSIVVGIGTLTAQSFVKYVRENKVRLVFSSITDPLGAGLVLKASSASTGVTNFVSLEPQLELFKTLLPNLKRLGILYNPGEANSVTIATKLRAECGKYGIELLEQTIQRTADVAQSTAKLASTADAIFISNDNTALSTLPIIIKIAEQRKIPVFVSDTDAVQLGAVAALGPNQYEIGQQTGRMIVRILKGQVITEAVEPPSKTELFVNLEAATKVGITIPKKILQQAVKVYPAGAK